MARQQQRCLPGRLAPRRQRRQQLQRFLLAKQVHAQELAPLNPAGAQLLGADVAHLQARQQGRVGLRQGVALRLDRGGLQRGEGSVVALFQGASRALERFGHRQRLQTGPLTDRQGHRLGLGGREHRIAAMAEIRRRQPPTPHPRLLPQIFLPQRLAIWGAGQGPRRSRGGEITGDRQPVGIGAGGLEQGQRRLLDQGGGVLLQQAQVDLKALCRHRGRRQAGVVPVVSGQIVWQLLPAAAEADFLEVAIQQLRMAEEKAAAQHRLATEGREWFGRIHRGAVLLQPQPLEPLRLPLNLPPYLHPQAGPGHPQALEAAAAAPLPPARTLLSPGAQPQPQPGQLARRQGRQGGIAGQQRQRQGQLPLGGLGVGRGFLQAGGLDRQRPPACRRAHLHQQGLVEAPARPIRRLGGLAGDGGTGQRLSRLRAQGGEQAGEAAALGAEGETQLDLARSLRQGQQPARHREPHPRPGIGRVSTSLPCTAEAGRQGSARGHRLGVNC